MRSRAHLLGDARMACCAGSIAIGDVSKGDCGAEPAAGVCRSPEMNRKSLVPGATGDRSASLLKAGRSVGADTGDLQGGGHVGFGRRQSAGARIHACAAALQASVARREIRGARTRVVSDAAWFGTRDLRRRALATVTRARRGCARASSIPGARCSRGSGCSGPSTPRSGAAKRRPRTASPAIGGGYLGAKEV